MQLFSCEYRPFLLFIIYYRYQQMHIVVVLLLCVLLLLTLMWIYLGINCLVLYILLNHMAALTFM